jgi:hypothetical protein
MVKGIGNAHKSSGLSGNDMEIGRASSPIGADGDEDDSEASKPSFDDSSSSQKEETSRVLDTTFGRRLSIYTRCRHWHCDIVNACFQGEGEQWWWRQQCLVVVAVCKRHTE